MIKTAILTSLACLGMAFSVDAQELAAGRFGDSVHASASFDSRADSVALHADAIRTPGGGHYETIRERVWVPGHYDEVLIPARYGWTVDACGHRIWGLISPERCQRVWHEGGYEIRERQIWVPDRCDQRPVFRPGHGHSGPVGVVQRGQTRGRPVLGGRRRR